MQKGTIIITKKVQELEGAKTRKEKKAARANFGVNKITPINEVHFFDMTRVDEITLQPMPASGADIFALIEKYSIREFGSYEDVLDKIKTVRASEFAEKYLLINALETDPIKVHEEWLLQNRSDLIQLGIKAVKKTCHFAKTVIASKIDAEVEGASIAKFPESFAFENDKDILKIALDIDVEQGETAEANGVLVIGLQTLITIGLAAAGVEPTTRFLTLANLKTKEAKAVRAPLGYMTTDLLAKVYGSPDGQRSFAGSGALSASPIELMPLVDFGTEILAYATAAEFKNSEACTACGDCQKICPLALPVHAVIQKCKLGESKLKRKEAKKYQDIEIRKIADACIKCGLCTYACPEGLDPMNLLASARSGEVRSRLVICKE